eukprot:4475437-Amphidinium_carterae.1
MSSHHICFTPNYQQPILLEASLPYRAVCASRPSALPSLPCTKSLIGVKARLSRDAARAVDAVALLGTPQHGNTFGP